MYKKFSLLFILLAVLVSSFSSHGKSNQSVLFVISAHDYGYWLPELVTPFRILQEGGVLVDVASPNGSPGVAMAKRRLSVKDRTSLPQIQPKLDQPLALVDINTNDYEAVYFVGGAGPMMDLYEHPQVSRIVNEFNVQNKLISADCHGPVALAGVKLANGTLFVNGREMTAKSNAEESNWAKSRFPFLLEDKLGQNNAKFIAASPRQPHVVVDGNLITGQNPESAEPLAHELLKMLQQRAQKSI